MKDYWEWKFKTDRHDVVTGGYYDSIVLFVDCSTPSPPSQEWKEAIFENWICNRNSISTTTNTPHITLHPSTITHSPKHAWFILTQFLYYVEMLARSSDTQNQRNGTDYNFVLISRFNTSNPCYVMPQRKKALSARAHQMPWDETMTCISRASDLRSRPPAALCPKHYNMESTATTLDIPAAQCTTPSLLSHSRVKQTGN